MIKTYFKGIKDNKPRLIEKTKKGSWILVTKPTDTDLETLASNLDLDIDSLRDAIDPYEAPRIAWDETDIYVFTRYCHPQNMQTATEPLLILITPNEILTVSPYECGFLEKVVSSLPVLTNQRHRILLEVLRGVNDTYETYLESIVKMTYRVRTQISTSSFTNRDFLKMIDVEEDLNEMLTSLQLNSSLLDLLLGGKVFPLGPDELEVLEDLRLECAELLNRTKTRLKTMENIRDVYNTISNASLNATFKRLTSIAIFMTIPTIVGGLYGMNIALPLASQKYAFFEVLGVIAIITTIVIYIFKRKKWL